MWPDLPIIAQKHQANGLWIVHTRAGVDTMLTPCLAEWSVQKEIVGLMAIAGQTVAAESCNPASFSP